MCSGPERAALSPALLERCRHVVRIPTRFALNLAVAGALVLYDRLLQHGGSPSDRWGAWPAIPRPRFRLPPVTDRHASGASCRIGWPVTRETPPSPCGRGKGGVKAQARNLGTSP